MAEATKTAGGGATKRFMKRKKAKAAAEGGAEAEAEEAKAAAEVGAEAEAEEADAAPEGDAEAEASATPKLNLNFGKKLAHPDKVQRDRGLRLLEKWLPLHPELTHLDYLKLWMGLFHGFWMSDKRPIQQELAVNIALLINKIPAEKQEMWISAFWETMQRHWEKLDTHRMNKFMLFVRIVVAEAFKALRLGQWNVERVRAMAEIFTKAIPGAPDRDARNNIESLGFVLQFMRVYWDELSPQLAFRPEASSEVLLQLCEPWCSLAEFCPSRPVIKRIHESIFLKSPSKVRRKLVERLLEGAGRRKVLKHNRECLYETADILEKQLISGQPAASKASPAELPCGSIANGQQFPLNLPSADEGTKRKTRRMRKRARAEKERKSAGDQENGGDEVTAKDEEEPTKTDGVVKKRPMKRKRSSGGDKKAEGEADAKGEAENGGEASEHMVVSPFMLPKAALPVPGEKRKKKRQRTAASA